MNIDRWIVKLFSRLLRPYGAGFIFTVLFLAGFSATVQAEERIAQIFQDNMVLQREKPVPVWGWGNPGAQIELTFGAQKKQAKVDEHGCWKVILDPMPANCTGQVLNAKIGNTVISRKNVLVGEVWIEAGHSNNCTGGPDLDSGIYPYYVSPGTKAGKPEIRICEFGFGASLEPLDDVDPAGRGVTP